MESKHNLKVFIIDDLPPEANAMTQALYSRSPKSVVEHLERVKEVGADKFMDSFYVGYGHKSIGDCGTTTIYLEDVSMFVAKAIQDWPLYNGQEASTRYLDMTSRAIINPVDFTPNYTADISKPQRAQSQEILDAWMNFYRNNQEPLVAFLKEKHPMSDGQNEAQYTKAIKARSFDIMRGFLPSGMTTNVSWHTNLRQAYDKLSLLKYHPLDEVRVAANTILYSLKQKYPNSFSHKEYEQQEKYRSKMTTAYTYYGPKEWEAEQRSKHINKGFLSVKSSLDLDVIKKFEDVLTSRPEKTELPSFVGEAGTLKLWFPLDFGSFRDIQRHRNGICKMPLLTTELGFHNWYLDQLPLQMKEEACALIDSQTKKINALEMRDEDKQYFIAMGFRVGCMVVYTIPETVYVAELRSTTMVHPTLREVAQLMGKVLEEIPGLKVYIDNSDTEWDIKRGKQDIVEK